MPRFSFVVRIWRTGYVGASPTRGGPTRACSPSTNPTVTIGRITIDTHTASEVATKANHRNMEKSSVEPMSSEAIPMAALANNNGPVAAASHRHRQVVDLASTAPGTVATHR